MLGGGCWFSSWNMTTIHEYRCPADSRSEPKPTCWVPSVSVPTGFSRHSHQFQLRLGKKKETKQNESSTRMHSIEGNNNEKWLGKCNSFLSTPPSRKSSRKPHTKNSTLSLKRSWRVKIRPPTSIFVLEWEICRVYIRVVTVHRGCHGTPCMSV